MGRVAKRYAKALFALTGGNIPKAKQQLAALDVLKELFQSKDSGKILFSPVMPPDLKRNLLNYGLEKGQADDDVRHLVQTVIDVSRVEVIPELVKVYADLIDSAEGVVRAEVVSASSLAQEELDAVSSALGKRLGRRILLQQKKDPGVLGGFIVRVGNFLVDMSVKTKLDGLARVAEGNS